MTYFDTSQPTLVHAHSSIGLCACSGAVLNTNGCHLFQLKCFSFHGNVIQKLYITHLACFVDFWVGTQITLEMTSTVYTVLSIFSSHNIIYSHENASGYYRVSAFFMSKAVTDLIPLRFIPNIVFALITYFMIGNGTFVTYVPVCQWRICMQMWHMSSTRTCMYMFYSKTKIRTDLVKVFWVFTSWISGKKLPLKIYGIICLLRDITRFYTRYVQLW